MVENQQPRQATAAQKADGPAEAVAGRHSQGQQAQSKAKGKYNQMIGENALVYLLAISAVITFLFRKGADTGL